MKRLVLIPFVLLLAVAAVYPQQNKDDKIKKIRDFYTSISTEIEKIDKDEIAANESEIAVNELVINSRNKSWPAVGNYSVVYRFYYKQIGEDHYPGHLIKVSRKTVSAARRFYEELVFDDNGKLMFYFEKTEDDVEHRLYFVDGKYLEYIGPGDKAVSASLTEGALEKARRLTELFDLSIL